MPKDEERPLKPEERDFLHGLYQNHNRALFDYACRLGSGGKPPGIMSTTPS
jgi:hypothetical protein